MIGYLRGEIIEEDIRSVIVLAGGVGYKVYTNTGSLGSKDPKNKVEDIREFWTYLAVRENALDLYGFSSKEELRFFELLITVSGIGPKSAMSILSVASVQNLRNAISSGDTSHLVKVSGVGKKNAEKIVVELKDKIGDFVVGASVSGDVDVLEALKSLGYGERESREVLKKIDKDGDTSERIKKALKLLS